MRNWRGLLLVGSLCACGGISTRSGEPEPADPSPTSVGECGGAPPEVLGCGGEGGERPLEDYARLRSACKATGKVSGRGAPVSVCFDIK